MLGQEKDNSKANPMMSGEYESVMMNWCIIVL